MRKISAGLVHAGDQCIKRGKLFPVARFDAGQAIRKDILAVRQVLDHARHAGGSRYQASGCSDNPLQRLVIGVSYLGYQIGDTRKITGDGGV